METRIFFLTLGLAFLVRAWPRLLQPDAIASDSYFHLSIARTIKENKHRIPDRLPRVITYSRLTYPFLFHWLFALLPFRSFLWAERYLSAGIDVMMLAVSFLIAKKYLAAAGFSDSLAIANWTLLLLALGPALLAVNRGPRSYHATPRTPGQLFFLVFMGTQLLYAVDPRIGYLLISGSAVALISLMSKFTNQAVVFMSLGLFLTGDFTPLLTALGGYAGAIVVAGEKVIHILRGQIKYSLFYFSHLRKVNLDPAHIRLLDYLAHIKEIGVSPKRAAIWFYQENFFWHRFIRNFPWLPLILIPVFSGAWPPEAGLATLYQWIFVSVALAAATAIKPLLFLGEADRYAEHTVFPQILLLVILYAGAGTYYLLPVLLLYEIVAYLVNVKIFTTTYQYWVSVKKEFVPLIARNDSAGARFFCIGELFWPALYASQRIQLLSSPGNVDLRHIPAAYLRDIMGNFPYPGIPIEELHKKYGVVYFAGSDDTFRAYASILRDDVFSSQRVTVVDREGSFVIFRLNPAFQR